MKISEIYDLYKTSSEVCTDTRKITENCIFFALKGANFNGNTFAEQAIKQGAKYAVIDEAKFQKDDRFILVEDALKALQDLANYHRNQLTIPVLGLTGSNGKTTTKELINVVLSKKYKVFATQGNFNNHIGVPLTLLSIPEDTEIAVIEMGANHIGEIEFLCNIAEPSHGFITNIGYAHIEGFGSFEGVARGKSELYRHLMKTDGVVFVNAQNEHLSRMATRFTKPPIYYLKKDGFYNVELVSVSPFICYKSPKGKEIHTQLIGAYNFENIATALCIGNYFEVEDELCHQAIQEYVSDNNRSQVIKKEKNKILMDAYNANPSSMNAALVNFEKIKEENKVLILGDMFELGTISEEEHKKIVNQVSKLSIDQAIFYGKEFTKVATENSKLSFFDDKQELLNYLKGELLTNKYILIKGSRGSKLEDVLDCID